MKFLVCVLIVRVWGFWSLAFWGGVGPLELKFRELLPRSDSAVRFLGRFMQVRDFCGSRKASILLLPPGVFGQV